MKIEQIYTGCLAEAAYYIESDGEAVIIDPLREIDPYVEIAKRNNAKIKYVLETHFHADFVSGHVDLAKKTGSTIVYGPTAQTNYEAHIAKDGEELKVGKVTIKVLHTPGHTLESTIYLLRDEQGKDHAIFTGDTLFLGDVGRPDLAIKQGELTKEDLAGFLYDSLRTKVMPLADDVIVYPAHGAGSACGKKMSSETSGTLGDQKATNYALRENMTKEEFVEEVLEGLADPPQYFQKNALMNKMGYESFDDVRKRGVQPMSVRAFKTAWEDETAIVLDTRDKNDFTKAFIPGSIFIGIDGDFAVWVGTLVSDLKQKILFLADVGKEEEVVTRLARVGYDNAIGYLDGGFDAWRDAGEEIDSLPEVTAKEFAELLSENVSVLDVRKESEFSSQHLERAQNFPLDFINRKMSEVNTRNKYYMYCRSGFRSVTAASILKSRGHEKVVNILGGFAKLETEGVPLSQLEEQGVE